MTPTKKQQQFLDLAMQALTFILNPKGLKEINHKDGDKLNNDICTLEWCTAQQNMSHAFTMGLINNTEEKNGRAKLTEVEVKEIRSLLSDGFTQQGIADMYNVGRTTIRRIKNRETWKNI